MGQRDCAKVNEINITKRGLPKLQLNKIKQTKCLTSLSNKMASQNNTGVAQPINLMK